MIFTILLYDFQFIRFVDRYVCTSDYLSIFRVSDTLPTGQLSNVPWRRTGVKYTNNEAYFDVIEEIDAIIDKSGATVFAEIQGYVSCLYLTLVDI